MLTSVPEGGIWLVTAPADMRKSFERPRRAAGIWSQRLEQGLFALPAGPRGESVSLSRTDLQALLDGVDFAAVRRRKRYARPRIPGPGKNPNFS